MKDIREPILRQLKLRLDPIGLPVKSFVPNNHKTPYIYIGGINTFQVQNKEAFELQGLITVELWSGTNEWKGSLKQPLKWLDEIKVRLQPTTRTRLDISPYFKMSYLRLENDLGIQQYGQTQRNWVATIEYDFEAMQILDAIEEEGVVHQTVPVEYNGEPVVHVSYLKYVKYEQ